MIDKATLNKIQSCKALQGKSVEDIISSDRFSKNLSAYITEQREARKAALASFKAMKKAGAKGYKLPAHPIDKTMDLTVADFVVEYAAVIAGASERPASERKYIQQLGQQAYNLTVAQYVLEEFPELEPALLPKADN